MLRHVCARCGKKSPVERMVFSTFTRQRYCSDVDACGRRARRKSRAAVGRLA